MKMLVVLVLVLMSASAAPLNNPDFRINVMERIEALKEAQRVHLEAALASAALSKSTAEASASATGLTLTIHIREAAKKLFSSGGGV